MRNPFEFGRELSATELVDREEEVATVVRTMRDRGRLFVIGPRRFGKTSILRAASEKIADDVQVLRYNVEAYPTLTRLAERIVVDAAEQIARPVERIGQKISRLFSNLRPQLTYDPIAASFSVTLTAESGGRGEVLIADVLDGLDRLAAEEERSIAVILDEFQRIVADGGVTAEGELRAAVQRHDHLAYIFAGSETGLITAMTGDADRPFYRLGERLFVGPIPRADIVRFLVDSFAKGGARLDEESATVLVELAGDVPYNIQRLAYSCWNDHLTGSSPTKILGSDKIEESLRRVLDRDDPFYSHLWSNLPSSQRLALLSVARENGRGLYSGLVLDRTSLPLSSMRSALTALVRKSILRPVPTDGTVHYLFEDPFLGHWVRRTTAEG